MIEEVAGSACEAWQRVIKRALSGSRELRDLIVTVVPNKPEDNGFIAAVTAALKTDGKPGVCTVANTIFPGSLWRENESREKFYARYRAIWPRLQKKKSNRDGTYFNRMIDFPGIDGSTFNQIEHVISAYSSGIRRRSTLQSAILHPALDLKATPYKGFPCLQQLAFQPDKEGLRVVAVYPKQYLWQRALGNYLGLISLGRFIATQSKLPFYGLTCICLSAHLEGPQRFRAVLNPLVK